MIAVIVNCGAQAIDVWIHEFCLLLAILAILLFMFFLLLVLFTFFAGLFLLVFLLSLLGLVLLVLFLLLLWRSPLCLALGPTTPPSPAPATTPSRAGCRAGRRPLFHGSLLTDGLGGSSWRILLEEVAEHVLQIQLILAATAAPSATRLDVSSALVNFSPLGVAAFGISHYILLLMFVLPLLFVLFIAMLLFLVLFLLLLFLIHPWNSLSALRPSATPIHP
mmetsp:Transcript_67349/g.177261  ORF Transcript_67349/g.177261 Transcript_67349/m.177261 type:complete len:221 (+) Transcript_67349:2609-3271(+)